MTPPEHVAVEDVTVGGRVEAARSTSWLRGPARAVALSVVGSWSTERSAPGAPAARLTRDGVGGRLAEPVSVPGGSVPRRRRCTELALVFGVVVSF